MTVTGIMIKNIIRKLLAGEDYGIAVNELITDEFLKYVIDFFKRVASAKYDNKDVTVDWYEKELLASSLSKDEIAIHAGLNAKTINNAYNSTKKVYVVDASMEHYHKLKETIESLIEQNDVDVTLTIKFRKVSVDLNINESLIVINTLAVKRAAIHGGLWSSIGKQAEKRLMMTLCALFQVPLKYYDQKNPPNFVRETDFFLRDDAGEINRCEVKLSGKGNPESSDSAFTRQNRVLVGNKISDKMKQLMDDANILWVELRTQDGWKKFEEILNELSVPCKPYPDHRGLQEDLNEILPLIIPSDDIQTSVTPDISNPNSELLIELD